MDKSDLRPLVLEALRQKPDPEFAEIVDRVHKLIPKRTVHETAISEIVWELLVQGMLAPGLYQNNHHFPYWPFVHVTDYGKQCLAAGDILPHDPDGYLNRLQQQVESPLDDIVLAYVRESLLTFLAGRYLAATVMLGVASERCIDMLAENCSAAIQDPGEKASLERDLRRAGRSVKKRYDVLRDKLLTITLPAPLRDALDIQLSGIFTLIRFSRNEAGHPTGSLVDRDVAHGNLLLFPQYCKRVYGLIEHFQRLSSAATP
jgi:hypothetical protein